MSVRRMRKNAPAKDPALIKLRPAIPLKALHLLAMKRCYAAAFRSALMRWGTLLGPHSLEEHQIDQPSVLSRLSEPGTGRMPILGLEQD